MGAGRDAVGAGKTSANRMLGRATSCVRHSFSRDTLVLTAAGLVAIGSLAVGDDVLAYDEATGTTAAYPVSVVHVHDDEVTGTVVIDGEPIETTPGHPFFTTEAGWTDAGDLRPGMHVPSADGDPGVVGSVDFGPERAIMYDLTVEVAHTYFVGEGAWLVHNCAPSGGPVWDANVQRYRDASGRFAPGPSRTNRVVIGESMETRVRPEAARLEASVYRPTKFSAGSRDQLRASARRNYQWMVNKIRQGARIYDKGRDPSRARRSIFYYLEQRAIRKYKYPVERL